MNSTLYEYIILFSISEEILFKKNTGIYLYVFQNKNVAYIKKNNK